MEEVQLYHGDCFERMKEIPDGSVALVLADPPYNIGVETITDCKGKVNAWDRIDDYPVFTRRFFEESARVLKENGVLYMWHNDMTQIAEIIHDVHERGQGHRLSSAFLAESQTGTAAQLVQPLRVLSAFL